MTRAPSAPARTTLPAHALDDMQGITVDRSEEEGELIDFALPPPECEPPRKPPIAPQKRDA